MDSNPEQFEPAHDAAQAEWERTTALDNGANPEDLDAPTAAGADPSELTGDDDDIPAADLPTAEEQPETDGTEPLIAELGDEGQGDLAPEDL